MSSSTEFRHLVRIAGKDLDGNKKLVTALSDLRGVGHNFSHGIVVMLGLDPSVRLGTLTDEQVKEVEGVLQDSGKLGLPEWFYNRRRDPESGDTKQLVGPNLDLAVRNDVEREKGVQSWRGVRHSLGLKVRGQRTRTTGRTGRTVGVRKAVLQAAARAAEQEKEKKE